MAYYMIQVAYTTEAWATLVKNPQNRTEAVVPVIEKLGGKNIGAWVSFGEYDIVSIVQMPDNVTVAALSMAFAAGGSTRSVRTTPLLSMEEGMEALKKAGRSGYKPPKA